MEWFASITQTSVHFTDSKVHLQHCVLTAS